MADLGAIVIRILISVVIFAISSLPLYFSVKFMGGKTTLAKTMLLVLISGFVIGIIQQALKIWGGIVAFLVMIWIYHVAFKLQVWKALLAWILQFFVVAIFYVLFVFIFITLLELTFLL
jgi:hypothetical protein